MKRQLIPFLTMLLLILFTTGCTKPIEPANNLNGTWEWKSTDGGLAHHLHQTPATTGKTEQLTLTGNHQYASYINNTLTEEGTYTVDEKVCIHDQQKKTVIYFSNSPQLYMVERTDGQQLILSDEHYDGIEIMYERKNEAHN